MKNVPHKYAIFLTFLCFYVLNTNASLRILLFTNFVMLHKNATLSIFVQHYKFLNNKN
jgi:hypothetical protein